MEHFYNLIPVPMEIPAPVCCDERPWMQSSAEVHKIGKK